MADQYHLTYDDVQECLLDIFRWNRRFCSYDVDYGVNPFSDDGDTVVDTFHPVGSRLYEPIRVRAGVKTLEANMLSDGLVRDQDAIMVIFQGFHESAHLWTHVVGYMQDGASSLEAMKDMASSLEAIKDMARTHVVGSYFKDYRAMIYVLDTSEIFANMSACKRIKPFLSEKAKQDPKFLELDVDDVLCSYFERLYSPSWDEMLGCSKIDDLICGFKSMMVRAPYRKKFSMKWLNSRPTLRPAMQFLLNNGPMVERILETEDGKAETDMLCHYVGRKHPSYFRDVLCIKEEYVGKNINGIVERVVNKMLQVTPQQWVDLPGFEVTDDNHGAAVQEDCSMEDMK